MSHRAVRLTVDPARLRRERAGVIVIPAVMIALAVFCVVLMGVEGLWMASVLTICPVLIAAELIRRLLWGRRLLGREVRLDDHGLTVTQDGRVERSIAWDEVTSVGGGESILTIRSRRDDLTLIPELCVRSRDFMLALRRCFHEREVERRLALADVRGDGAWGCVWTLAVLAMFTVPAFHVIQGLMLFEDTGERTQSIRYVANALAVAPPLAGLAGGLRFSYTWGSHRIGRGLLFPTIAAVAALFWMLAACHAWFVPEELAWRALLAGVLAAAGAYAGNQAGRHKLWTREHVDRETGAAPFPEGEIIRPSRRWILLSFIGLGGFCIALLAVGVPSVLFAPAGPFGPAPVRGAVDVAAMVFALGAMAFIGFFTWWEVRFVGVLRHQAIRASAEAFDYWDRRGRLFTVPWDQVTSVEALNREGVVRIHQTAGENPARVDLSDTIAWHKGLETQLLRLFRERAHLTQEEPLLKRKLRVGTRYARGDDPAGAS